MTVVYVLGLAAAILMTAAGLPQILYMLKTKNTTDVSLSFILMLMTGQGMMFVHLLMSNALTMPLTINYVVSFFISGLMLYAKLKFK